MAPKKNSNGRKGKRDRLMRLAAERASEWQRHAADPFEYLDDVDELCVRRGVIHAQGVA